MTRTPVVAGQTLLEVSKKDGETASTLLLGLVGGSDPVDDDKIGTVVGTMANLDPRTTGQVLSGAASDDEDQTGRIICACLDDYADSTGLALGYSAGEDPDSTNRALGSVYLDTECVSQLGTVIPTDSWMPEEAPQEGVDLTGRGVWQDIGSPRPIENILARFSSIISDAKTVITNLDDPPTAAAPLPPDRIPYGYVDIGRENFEDDDVIAAHVTISVEREWLDANQVHEWSMQFSRYEDSTSRWVPTRTKRVRQDDDKVFFSVTIPGFSLYAVHGASDAPVVGFVETNLTIIPSDHDRR